VGAAHDRRFPLPRAGGRQRRRHRRADRVSRHRRFPRVRGRLPPRRGPLSARALAFDFNGTLSNDEDVYCGIFRELFAAAGRPLTREQYFDELVGLPDTEIIRRWLGADPPEAERLVAERIRLYRERTRDGESIPEQAREAVLAAAARVPVAIVSGDFREEIEHALAGAGLTRYVSLLVALEDVRRPKPYPDGYLLALKGLGGLRPEEVVAIEDTEVGVASAKAAGLCCVAVLGTVPAERLREADEIAPRLDAALVERMLT
jgi:HAD superfamily hydrolase (TIGR01509 family)